MDHSSINASESWISHMSNKVKSGGGINLAQGIPGFRPPAELLQILSGISHNDIHQYPPGNGYPELVKQICRSYSPVADIQPGEVLVVQGATEGISLAYTYMINIYGKRWSALAFDPVYESYGQLPAIFHNKLVRIPQGQSGSIDRNMVEKKVRAENVKLVFVNSPGNPFGRVWSEEDFDWIFGLAEKFDFRILLDAVYKDLYFGEDEPHTPISGNKDRIFYVNSFSKMLSITGWRIGYLIAGSRDMANIRAIHDYIGLCAPSVLQYAISEYLSVSDYGSDYTGQIRDKLSDNYSLAKTELEKSGFYVEPAGGGYFVWCRLPSGAGNGVDFAIKLYDNQKVGIVPGIHFSGEAGFYVRINIAREKEELVEGLSRIRQFAIGQGA